MKDLDVVLQEVELVMRQQLHSQQQLGELVRAGFGVALQDELQADLRQSMSRNRQRLLDLLQRTLDFPPRHMRHFPVLEQFWGEGTYEKSVFIMSKFPDGADRARNDELERVLESASQAVLAAGFEPRIARSPNRYHDAMWDNVELHLLGCRQGVAIVEDRYLDELNPNVAMEWGWMRGMGKPVLFLIEEGFTHSRADITGLIEDSFRWEDPEVGMTSAITTWLAGGDA